MALSAISCNELHEPGLGEESAALSAAIEAEAKAAELETLDAFIPVHLLAEDLLAGAPNLTLTTTTTINTSALTLNGSANSFFVQRGDYAVLFTDAFTVQAPITISGSRPLIIAAGGHVLIASSINLGAVGTTAGPGALTTGAGVGGAGTTFLGVSTRQSSGGGGGGYGTTGANGGGQPPNTPPGLGGATNGASVTDPLTGGSRGGHGGFSLGGTSAGAGGAGGGALQISSQLTISMGVATINAAGGGGNSGVNGFYGGGGGGSGGQILFEAPSISVIGTLAANGGGGGGGGSGGGSASTNGANGTTSTTPAAGGIGNAPQGSNGGAGAAGATAAVAGANFNSKGGGGGGGAGRIWLRYRAATPPNVTSALITPAPSLDSSLP